MSDDPLDALYAVPPADFVAARDRLAGERRRAGDRDGAAAIRKLTKPSASAWAASRAGRLKPDVLARLFESSDELRRAQMGGSAARAAFQQATGAQRAAIDELVAAAREALEGAGLAASQTTLERVANDLRWGAADPVARALLAQGRLREDVEPPGFGSLLGGQVADVDAAPRPVGEAKAGRDDAAASAQKARDEERAALQRELRVAVVVAERAAGHAETAREAAGAAERDVSARRRELEAAEARFEIRARARDEAAAAAAAASAEVERLEAALAAARG